MTDDIRLVVNSNDYSGWYEQDFQRSMEDLCGRFTLTALYDRRNPAIPVINDGDKCQLYLGKDLLMTGHVDAANPFYNRDDIGIRIEGRDLAADIVDSSARFGSGEWNNVDYLRIATDLCGTKGISVVLDSGVDIGAPFRPGEARIESGEMVEQTLSRLASYRGLLLFSDEFGRVVISKASKYRAPTMLKAGANIIAAERAGGMQNLFYLYQVQGQGSAVVFGKDCCSLSATAIDKQIRKTRELIICAESAIDPASYQQRADATLKQRRGRAAYYIYTLDDWTHQDGTPWRINQRVDVDDAFMGLSKEEFITAGVNYKCTRKDGKTCVLTLKKPNAFDELPAPNTEIVLGVSP